MASCGASGWDYAVCCAAIRCTPADLIRCVRTFNFMAENNKSGKKELTMEQRLLLAFVLMGLVLFLTPYFYKAPPPPPKTATPTSSQANSAGTKAAAQPAPQATASHPVAAVSQPVPGQIEASAEQQFVIDTDIYQVTLSNRGGTVRGWVLKKYRDHADKPLELVNAGSFSKVAPPLSIVLKD